MRRSSIVLASCLVGLAALLPSAARAEEPWAARLVRVLDRPGLPHPLADETGNIPLVVGLSPGVDAAALGLARIDPIAGAQRMSPAGIAALAAAIPGAEMHVGPPLRPLLNVATQRIRTSELRVRTGYDGTGVIVGVLDTGIDFAHPDFRNADGSTRIRAMLIAGDPAGIHPELEEKYCGARKKKCAVYFRDDINVLLAGAPPIQSLDRAGHGTHVTSIAAGNGGPSVNKVLTYAGVAPGADLVIAAPSPGGFFDDDVVAGANFVFDMADRLGQEDGLPEGEQKPTVLNLSIGGDYGAHDGTGILERCLSRLVGDDHPGRAIVVASGNSGALFSIGDDGPYGIHTEARVYEHSDVRIPIRAPAAPDEGRGYAWITFQPEDHVSVALEAPDGSTWVGWTAPGDEAGFSDGPNRAGIVNNVFKKDGQLYQPTNGAVVVWAGKWKAGEFAIHLSGDGLAQLWLQSGGDVGDGTGMLFRRALQQGTINVPASAPGLLAVGCTVNRLTWPVVTGGGITLPELGGDTAPENDSACYFSSTGPTPFGLPKPEITAPGAFVVGAMASNADPRTNAGGLFSGPDCPEGSPECYVADDTHAVAAGTSMSAPMVTGSIALLFQAYKARFPGKPLPTQAQMTAILQAGARYPVGKVPNPVQIGVGGLDVLNALRVMEQETALLDDVDVGKSWYVMSSKFARPDGKWPVYGTIELRLPNGNPASGVDGTRVAVSVRNGMLVRPLRKIRHGLFQFAVAGLENTGGTTMNIDVTYDGASLGAQTLRVSEDAWTDQAPIATSGACALAPRPPSNAPGNWLAALGVAAVILGRATRRRR